MFNDSLRIRKLAFGCARLNSLSYKLSSKIIEECLENKILHFDTAPSYGSEKLIGDILKGVGNTTITSKIGLPRVKSSNKLIEKIYKKSLKKIGTMAPSIKNKFHLTINKKKFLKNPKRFLSMDEIMFDLEKTLTNINKSRLDILLIHEPDQFIIDEDLIEKFEQLKKEGLIADYGLGYNQSDFESIKFGNVKQYLYSDKKNYEFDSINIVHGLIRASILKGNRGYQHSEFINSFLLNNKASVLFSASTVNQVKEVCSNIS